MLGKAKIAKALHMNAPIDKRIFDAVRETMADQFATVKVHDVNIENDTDQFGDDVLHIDVVHGAKKLDPRKTAGFISNLRQRLFGLNELKFPIVYFVSHADWKKYAKSRKK